jgi:anti-anti-sigma regulatory factor
MSNPSGISVFCQEIAVHVRIDGRAVAHDCPALRRYVEAALNNGCRAVYVHLDRCEHFDSTFLGTLLCLRSGGEVDLRLVNTSDAAQAIMKRMGATALFHSGSDEELPEHAHWLPCESEQPGQCSHEFKRNVVQAHQRLAEVEGPLGDTYRQIAELAARDLEAAQER